MQLYESTVGVVCLLTSTLLYFALLFVLYVCTSYLHIHKTPCIEVLFVA